MMKKLLVLMMVFGMASAALANPYFEISGPLPIKESYLPSDWIEINLMDNGLVDAFSVEAIVDVICPGGGSPGGIADEPQTMADFGYKQFGWLNYEGLLVIGVAGGITSTTEPPQTGKLYSFMYHVPDVPASTLICIESFSDGFALPVVMYRDGSQYEGPIGMDVCIHVIPEPATIALLGLGGLLLRRRK